MHRKLFSYIFTIIILIITLLLLISYAYFTPKIEEKTQNISVKPSNIVLNYNDCDDIDNCSNIIVDDFYPGEYITKSFKVENTSNKDVYFNFIFESIENTFINDEIKYTLVDTDTNEVIIDNYNLIYGSYTNYKYMDSIIEKHKTKNYMIKFIWDDSITNSESNKNSILKVKLGISVNN